MRDDDELRQVEEVAQDRGEAADVGLVQRGIHLVEQAERAGLAPKDRQQQRHRRQRLLAAA